MTHEDASEVMIWAEHAADCRQDHQNVRMQVYYISNDLGNISNDLGRARCRLQARPPKREDEVYYISRVSLAAYHKRLQKGCGGKVKSYAGSENHSTHVPRDVRRKKKKYAGSEGHSPH